MSLRVGAQQGHPEEQVEALGGDPLRDAVARPGHEEAVAELQRADVDDDEVVPSGVSRPPGPQQDLVGRHLVEVEARVVERAVDRLQVLRGPPLTRPLGVELPTERKIMQRSGQRLQRDYLCDVTVSSR